MRAMAETVSNDVGQRQLVHDFLIGWNRSRVRRYPESRRSRILTKHRVRPIYARIDDCYIDSLTFISIGEVRKRCHVVWIFSVEFRRANVGYALE